MVCHIILRLRYYSVSLPYPFFMHNCFISVFIFLLLSIRLLRILLLQDIQEQFMLLRPLLREVIQENVRELKEDVLLIKNKMEAYLNRECTCRAKKTVETTLENPFETLRSFGFKASSVEEVSELLHNVLCTIYILQTSVPQPFMSLCIFQGAVEQFMNPSSYNK